MNGEIIDNPEEYFSSNDPLREDQIIVDIEEDLAKKDDWERITDEWLSDHHYESCMLRFRYTYADRNGLLMVQDDGQVCINGAARQQKTFFKVIHNFENNQYQIICTHGKNKNHVLYMDGDRLKARLYYHGKDEDSPDTMFEFEFKGNNSWIIKAKYSGTVLTFDPISGIYLPPSCADSTDCPPYFSDPDVNGTFYAYIPRKFKVTTV